MRKGGIRITIASCSMSEHPYKILLNLNNTRKYKSNVLEHMYRIVERLEK